MRETRSIPAVRTINIAHDPGADPSTLYGLTQVAPVFRPDLAAQPNDFTVALSFAGGALYYPYVIAIDGEGNI